MPAFPELRGILRLIWRVEVLRQVEAHQHCYAGGNVRVAGEVGINLERIAEYGSKILESGVEQRILEHTITEIHSDVVAQYQLLCQTVHNPEHRNAELLAAKEEWLVQLRQELIRAHDRACYQLRKEAKVETEIEEISHRLGLPSEYVNHVAHRLEREEGYSHRQEYAVHAESLPASNHVSELSDGIMHCERSPEEIIHDIGQEVGVFVIAQQQQIHYRTKNHDEIPCEFGLSRVEPPASEIVKDYYKDEKHQEKPAGLVIEKKAHEEQEGIPQQDLVLEEAEEGHDYCEERPEIELCEQKRVSLIEAEQVLEKVRCHVPESHSLFLNMLQIFIHQSIVQ